MDRQTDRHSRSKCHTLLCCVVSKMNPQVLSFPSLKLPLIAYKIIFNIFYLNSKIFSDFVGDYMRWLDLLVLVLCVLICRKDVCIRDTFHLIDTFHFHISERFLFAAEYNYEHLINSRGMCICSDHKGALQVNTVIVMPVITMCVMCVCADTQGRQP